ncbi:MAG: hypothetical protein M1387_11390 [Thaumarchaeota archaeon]|nr:hypothetical protein [Nitrososphaerota archaeon]
MCQVEGCNNKGIMVNGIVLADKTYGSITLDIFICEEHSDDPRFLATEWVPSMQPVSKIVFEEISVERSSRAKERRGPSITSSSNSCSINSQRNVSSSSNLKHPRLKRSLQLP